MKKRPPDPAALRYIGNDLTVVIDRPLGSDHPLWGFRYPINYGYVPGTQAPDGEPVDAYVLGVVEAIETFTGRCVALIHREDDQEDKLIVAPRGKTLTDIEILQQTLFQEQFIRIRLLR